LSSKFQEESCPCRASPQKWLRHRNSRCLNFEGRRRLLNLSSRTSLAGSLTGLPLFWTLYPLACWLAGWLAAWLASSFCRKPRHGCFQKASLSLSLSRSLALSLALSLSRSLSLDPSFLISFLPSSYLLMEFFGRSSSHPPTMLRRRKSRSRETRKSTWYTRWV
jgi:hypothetical protein